MHQEHYVSTTKIAALTLWGLVAGLLSSTWVLAIVGGDTGEKVAILLAFTACALSPAAAVAHLRVYALKTTSLIRIAHGLGLPDGPPTDELRVVR